MCTDHGVLTPPTAVLFRARLAHTWVGLCIFLVCHMAHLYSLYNVSHRDRVQFTLHVTEYVHLSLSANCFQLVTIFRWGQKTFTFSFFNAKRLCISPLCISTDMFSGAGSYGWEIEDSQSTGVRHRVECRHGGVVSCPNEQQHPSLWNISTAERGEWAHNIDWPMALKDWRKWGLYCGKVWLIENITVPLLDVSAPLLRFII